MGNWAIRPGEALPPPLGGSQSKFFSSFFPFLSWESRWDTQDRDFRVEESSAPRGKVGVIFFLYNFPCFDLGKLMGYEGSGY